MIVFIKILVLLIKYSIFYFSFLQHDHVSVIRSIMMYSLTSLVTLIIAFAIFNYMETGVPEGVPEVWNARILDTSLRTMGKVVSCDRLVVCGSKRVTVLFLTIYPNLFECALCKYQSNVKVTYCP